MSTRLPEKIDLGLDVPLDAFVRRVSRLAEKVFAEQGEFPPLCFVVQANGESCGIGTPFRNSPDDPFAQLYKSNIAEMLRRHFEENDVARYAFVAECWASQETAIRPSLSKKRFEVLMIAAQDRDGSRVTAAREIIRPEDRKHYLGKLEIKKVGKFGPSTLFGDLLTIDQPVRTSDELPDDEGRVFVTRVPDAPFQVLGRRGPTGELFVGSLLGRAGDPIDLMKEIDSAIPRGVEIVTGEEAERLIVAVMRQGGGVDGGDEIHVP